jgi:hypothetical protein
MRKTVAILALSLGFSSLATASTLSGSLVFSAFGASIAIDGVTVGSSTFFTPIAFDTPGVFTGLATGSYSVIPNGSPAKGGEIDITNLSAFSLDFGTYGTFAAASGVIVTQITDFADFLFTGTYTPGPGLLPATAEGFTTVRVSVNKTGDAIAYAGSLDTSPIPEPATFALLGIGLLSVVLFRRKVS